MKANYIQRGNDINYTNNTDKAIELGEVVSLDGRVAVAADNIPAGGMGVLHLTGAYAMAKASGEEIAVGAVVYYNATDDCITATADSNTLAGVAITNAAASDASVVVRIG